MGKLENLAMRRGRPVKLVFVPDRQAIRDAELVDYIKRGGNVSNKVPDKK